MFCSKPRRQASDTLSKHPTVCRNASTVQIRSSPHQTLPTFSSILLSRCSTGSFLGRVNDYLSSVEKVNPSSTRRKHQLSHLFMLLKTFSFLTLNKRRNLSLHHFFGLLSIHPFMLLIFFFFFLNPCNS